MTEWRDVELRVSEFDDRDGSRTRTCFPATRFLDGRVCQFRHSVKFRKVTAGGLLPLPRYDLEWQHELSWIVARTPVCMDDAPEWQRESAVKGVEFNLANPDAPASASHDSWLAVKDAEKKEHPCYVPYDQLPKDQQRKDAVFKAVVAALAA